MVSVNANGTTLEVSERGEGQPVALVHGSAGDHRTWHRQIETFAGRFRTISYSRRFHWPNEPIAPEAEYSLHQHVDDLIALLGELDSGPAHLVHEDNPTQFNRQVLEFLRHE